MSKEIKDFISSIDNSLYNKIRQSKSDAECRRYLREHLEAIDYTHCCKSDSELLPYKDKKLIGNMCLSFRHDFGLLPKLIQDDLKRDCKNWLIAYENNRK